MNQQSRGKVLPCFSCLAHSPCDVRQLSLSSSHICFSMDSVIDT